MKVEKRGEMGECVKRWGSGWGRETCRGMR